MKGSGSRRTICLYTERTAVGPPHQEHHEYECVTCTISDVAWICRATKRTMLEKAQTRRSLL